MVVAADIVVVGMIIHIFGALIFVDVAVKVAYWPTLSNIFVYFRRIVSQEYIDPFR